MSRTLRIGDRGSDVRAVQDVLNFHIRRLAPLVVDGRFGTETQGRVREFQRANRLTIDGVVGSQTSGKLFENEVQSMVVGIIPRLVLPGQPDSDPRAQSTGATAETVADRVSPQ